MSLWMLFSAAIGLALGIAELFYRNFEFPMNILMFCFFAWMTYTGLSLGIMYRKLSSQIRCMLASGVPAIKIDQSGFWQHGNTIDQPVPWPKH